MAFGITRSELINWKLQVSQREIAFLTHFWHDKRFPHYSTVTKVGCSSVEKLIQWGKQHELSSEWIHHGKYPHFDLMGKRQYIILLNEGLTNHIEKFNLMENNLLEKLK